MTTACEQTKNCRTSWCLHFAWLACAEQRRQVQQHTRKLSFTTARQTGAANTARTALGANTGHTKFALAWMSLQQGSRPAKLQGRPLCGPPAKPSSETLWPPGDGRRENLCLNPSTHAMRPALPLLLLPYNTGGDTREGAGKGKKSSAANQAPPLPRAAPSSTTHTQLAARCRPRVRTMMYSSPRQLVGCPHLGPARFPLTDLTLAAAQASAQPHRLTVQLIPRLQGCRERQLDPGSCPVVCALRAATTPVPAQLELKLRGHISAAPAGALGSCAATDPTLSIALAARAQLSLP